MHHLPNTVRNTLLVALAIAATPTVASPPQNGGPPLGTRFNIEGGYLHQFETDIDDGGDFSVGRLLESDPRVGTPAPRRGLQANLQR